MTAKIDIRHAVTYLNAVVLAAVSNDLHKLWTQQTACVYLILNRRFFQHEALTLDCKKGKRKVQGVSQSQTAAPPKPQEEEETDKSKQAQTEQTYEKH